MRKIVLLIIDDDGSGDTFYSLAKEVWRYNLRGRDIPYYFLNATQRDLPSGQIWVDSDTILTRYHENFNQRVTEKTYLGIKHCQENMAFDFLLRTNLSSFYNLPPLIEYLDALEAHNIYAGKITTQYYQDDHGRQQSFSFCSGSGFLLSRDVCEKVIHRHQMVDKNLIDDVWIRLILQDIQMLDMPRCDLIKMGRYCSNTLDFAEQQILRSVEAGVFHFRVKDCFDDLPRSVGDAIALEMLRKSFC